MEKSSFTFFKSYYDAIKEIPEEYQLELYNAIFEYYFEGKEPENLSSISKAMFILIKPNIDSSIKKYSANQENGKKGGRPRNNSKNEEETSQNKTEEKSNKNPKITQQKPKENPKETQSEPTKKAEKEKDKEKDKEKKKNISSSSNNNINNIYNTADAKKLHETIIETLGTTNLNSIKECIDYLDKLPLELIEHALKKTSRIERPNWNYAMSILESYIDKGFKSLKEAEADDLHFKNKKDKSISETMETEEEKNKRKANDLREAIKSGG